MTAEPMPLADIYIFYSIVSAGMYLLMQKFRGR